MSSTIDIKIKAGNTQGNTAFLPTVINENTPYISWVLPPGIVQKRFNLRMKSLNTFAEFISGETKSSNTFIQWPFGYAMNSNWSGAVHIQILISEDDTIGGDFEYTSTDISELTNSSIFVYDTLAETIFITDTATYRWKASIDPNPQSIQYQYQIANDPLFGDIVLNKTTDRDSGGFILAQENISTVGTYYWRVRAYDGMDYSDWSIQNGFKIVDDAIPVVRILDVIVTDNEYGDVIVYFSVEDADNAYISLVAEYSGGTVAVNETKHCSTINNLHRIANGNYSFTWRSSRDEKLIEASNYMIYLQGWDGIVYSDTAEYGPFHLDNRAFGIPAGGLGAIEIEFPMIDKLINKNTYNYSIPFVSPIIGYRSLWNGWSSMKEQVPIRSEGFKYYSVYMEGQDLPYSTSEQYVGELLRVKYPDIIGSSYLQKVEDEGTAPAFTLDPNKLSSDGYPYHFDYRNFSNLGNRNVYVKIYYPEKCCVEEDPVYKYKNWKVELINGEYTRVTVNDGLRGKSGYSVDAFVAVPIYVESNVIFSPTEYDANANAKFTGKMLAGKWEYFWGTKRKADGEIVYPYPILGTKTDQDAPPTLGSRVLQISHDYSEKNQKYGGSIYRPTKYTLPDLGFEGTLFPGRVDYFSGYPVEEHPGFTMRRNPTWKGDRGFTLEGFLTEPVTIETLRFIYLQSEWDAYNTIHWSASLGHTTKIELQYAEYITETTYVPFTNLITTDSEFDDIVHKILIKPLTWSTYLDTIAPNVFKDGKHYKLRMRLIDPITNTYTSYVYSSKFLISHNTANPVNILDVIWKPWRKQLVIEFRVDDTQGDNYDIYFVQYSVDGRTWHNINMRDIDGRMTELTSNLYGDTAARIITHSIIWNTRAYNLVAGDNYRIRIFATLSNLRNSSQKPVFDWTFYPNTLIKYAETRMKYYSGVTQFDVFDETTQTWVKLDKPQVIPGKIERNLKLAADIKAVPYPYGVLEFYQDHDETKPIVDMTGYTDWMNTKVDGVSRAQLLASLENENEEIRNTILPGLYDQRDIGEMIVRRNLIKQGFYCNGYVDNDKTKARFRWRVEQGPEDQPAPGVNYYDPKYEVYYRIQVDFADTFDSQLGNKPLRDIYFDKAGSRIQNITAQKIDIVDPATETTMYQYTNPAATDKPWTDGATTTSSSTNKEQEDQFTTIPYAKYCFPIDQLPGERADYYINPSYPSMTDTLPSGVETYDYDYYMRITAYNIISAARMEYERNLITEITIVPESNRIDFTFLAASDESTTQLIPSRPDPETGIIKWEWSKETQTPVWTNKEIVLFPTDRPSENDIVVADDGINGSITIEGRERIRPSVVITANHQYYLWFTKTNKYNENVVIQALGKNWKTFGEYSVANYMYASKSITALNVDSLYAPFILTDENDYFMWVTGIKDSANNIYFSKSNRDLDVWTEVVACTGLEGCYYPSVLYENNIFKLWCCKLDSGLSKVFYYTSSNGTTWTLQGLAYENANNLNSPCIIKTSGGYIMYFTEYTLGGSNIASVYSVDGISWDSYELEIDDGDVCHPAVVVDRYAGNNIFRMYYNQLVDGKYIIKTAFLEDRVWNTGITIIIPQTIIPTVEGVLKQGSIDIDANEMGILTVDSDIKIRLYYDNSSGNKDYLVQSEWRIGSDETKSLTMNPNGRWKYDSVWKSIAYEGS